MESYEQVAKRLQVSTGALESLIDDNGGRQAIWAERDALIAKTLAQLAAANPEADSMREVARIAQEKLPGLQDFHVTKLKKRHPELLAKVAARGMHAPVPPEARKRIVELALAHPTLDYAALAKLYAKDPKLAKVLEWSEAEVSRLREPSRIVPSEAKRKAALVTIATAALTKAKGSLDDAIAKLAEQHPGVTRAQLVDLGAHDPPLAKQLRRLDETGAADAPEPAVIDAKLARKLDLGPSLVARCLEASKMGLVQELSAAIRTIEKNAGNNDGVLAPRDVADESGLVALVIARVYAQLGKKSLPLDKIEAALPAAIAALAEKGALSKDPELQQLHLTATREAVDALSRAYTTEVIEGGGAATHFHLSWKIVSKAWARIRDTLPSAFPEPGAKKADPGRLDAISKLYDELLDGTLTTTGFYSRAKIGKDELRLLQATDPERFPRPEGTPSWKTVVGRKNVGELDLDGLSLRYKSQVVSGESSLGEFLRDEGVSKHRFAALRAEHPGRFDALEGKKPDHVLAKAMGKLARKAFEDDVLTDVPQVIAKLNADPKLVELVGGKILRSRYEALRSKFPNEFPKFKDPSLILPVLAEEVRALLEVKPGLTPIQITKEMKKKHPAFRTSRVHQLRAAYPELLPLAAKPKVDRAADAELLAKRMKAHPGRTLQQLADELAPLGERFTAPYLNRLRKDFQKTIFTDPAIAFKPRPMARESLVVAELYAMVLRLSPPGITERDRMRALDALLEARGIPPYGVDKPTSGLLKTADARYGTAETQSARVVAEIAAEYAAVAKPGHGEKEIFAAILADYPTLDQQKLSTYRNLWAKEPPAALAHFIKGGKVTLAGQGKKLDEPRFLGGWDVDRALLDPAAKDPKLARALAELSANARMPLVLPLLDTVLDRLDGKKPLVHKNLLWVTHVLASTYALSVALRQAGAQAAKTMVVGTPYGTNETARAALAADGFDVRRPALDPSAYRAEVEAAIDRMVKMHQKNQEPIVVMDDGGLVAEILRSNPKKYGDVIGQFKIVEQTTRGITAAEQDVVPFPVINVARSKSKIAEGALIGRAVAAKVLQGLERVGKTMKGERVTVVGFGTIGAKIAAEARKAGAIVTIVEPSPARAKEAQKAGFEVQTKAQAFPKSNVVIGATGVTATKLEDLKLLPDGAVFTSASSKRLEFDMGALEKASKKVTDVDPGTPLVTLPTRTYSLAGKQLTALGDGWPINFDGDVEDIPPEQIQLTRAVMLSGAIQAASTKPHQTANQGVIPLDEELDKAVLEGFRALMKGKKAGPIGDPSKWRDVLRESAATIASAVNGDDDE